MKIVKLHNQGELTLAPNLCAPQSYNLTVSSVDGNRATIAIGIHEMAYLAGVLLRSTARVSKATPTLSDNFIRGILE